MGMKQTNLRRLKTNSIWSIAYTVSLLISGFILPRLIINYYGSEENGLISSITQFLQVFTLLELGVATVTKTSLYSAVSDGDHLQINRIVSAISKFYRSIGLALVVYVIALLFIYPNIIEGNFGFWHIAILILTYSMHMFVQYYFGIVDICILDAYQEAYIYYIIQTVSTIMDIVLSVYLVFSGFSIYAVKILVAIIYMFRPIAVRAYIHKKYVIDRKEKYIQDPIKEKWNGVTQHISFIVLQSTDMVLLTLFSTLLNVSVYSIYNLVISGMNSIITAAFINVATFMGKLDAQNGREKLKYFFRRFDLGLHCMVAVLYGCTSTLIIEFVMVYTRGISDVDYCHPAFAFFIVLANAWFCLRLPYVLLIQATGGYRENQGTFIYAACINILVSIILLNKLGLVGIAIGTLFAMVFQTMRLAFYTSKRKLNDCYSRSLKLFFLDMVEIVIIYAISRLFTFTNYTYFSWIILAVKMFFISIFFVMGIQYLFNKSAFCDLLRTSLFKSMK